MEHELRELLAWFTGHGFGLTDIIGILSIVAAITPTPVDNALLIALKKIVNAGAFNWAEAENKKKPGEPKV